jgi:cell division protein FtsL
MDRKKKDRRGPAPILRMRHLPVIAVVVAALITGPLLVVWKQVYLTKVSMKRAAISDTLTVLSKQAAQLRFMTEKLSSTSRIEAIAHERLGLEYPASGQIVIIKGRADDMRPSDRDNGFIAFLRRSLPGNRG